MHQDVFNRYKHDDRYQNKKLFPSEMWHEVLRKYCGNGVPDWAAHPKKENFPYPLEVNTKSYLILVLSLIYTILPCWGLNQIQWFTLIQCARLPYVAFSFCPKTPSQINSLPQGWIWGGREQLPKQAGDQLRSKKCLKWERVKIEHANSYHKTSITF